jgi:hypothetical protein
VEDVALHEPFPLGREKSRRLRRRDEDGISWKYSAAFVSFTPFLPSSMPGSASLASGTEPNRSWTCSRPAGFPGTPQEAAPQLKICGVWSK